MRRRRFLKLLGLGGVVAAAPWSLVTDETKPRELSEPKQVQAKLTAIASPSVEYRVIVVEEDGTEVWAPKTERFEKTDTGVTFFAAHEHQGRVMTVAGFKLISPRGEVVGEREVKPIVISQDDTLRVSYTVNAA